MIAGAIAIVAAARAVQLALRLDEERTARLSRTLVIHGAAVLVVGASAILGGLETFAAVLVALAAGSWGFAWILIGRSYDTAPARLEALRREERAVRATPTAAQRFGRPQDAPGGDRAGEPSRRAP